MSKPHSGTIFAHWKLSMPATLTARVDLLLRNPLTNKPAYGERSRITATMWEDYLARLGGKENAEGVVLPLPNIPGVVFEIDGRKLTFDDIHAAINKEAA